MLGQDPPTYRRSITATRFPCEASVQARSLPAAPLPRMTRSYSSAVDMVRSTIGDGCAPRRIAEFSEADLAVIQTLPRSIIEADEPTMAHVRFRKGDSRNALASLSALPMQ